jgi:hypothetical protein
VGFEATQLLEDILELRRDSDDLPDVPEVAPPREAMKRKIA